MIDENTLKPEQSQAINTGSGNILVSASAGSGKTFVMIRRIIRLIVKGNAHADEILAATFTEAAAADMKEKLKKAIVEEIESGKSTLADELARVSTADICTLHSFCGRLVRTYFFAAGVSPDFKVADESESQALKQDALEETFKSFYDAKDEKFLAFIDRFRANRKTDGLREIIMKAHEFCESEVDPDNFLSSFKENYTEAGAGKLLAEFADRLKSASETLYGEFAALKDECSAAGVSSYANYCGQLCDIVREIEEKGLDTAKNYALSGALPRMPSDKSESAKALNERVKALKNKLSKLCEYTQNIEYDPRLFDGLKENAETFYAIVKRFSDTYDRLKRDSDLLDFSDLERFALIALSDEKVKAAVHEKYKYVFVDEYQDVNAVQEEIISKVADGNLFMVGDVKQSIYGFRGCRSEIFENKQKTIADNGGTAIKLNYNFRSAENVIKKVNDIFDFCYIPEYTGLDYAGTSRLESGGIYPKEAQGRFELHHLDREKAEKSERPAPHIYNILDEAFKTEETEATRVSNLLSEIIDEELTKEYYDIKTKSFRRVKMKDIAILTRAGETNDYVQGIVKGLRGHGIRVLSGVAQNVCDFPEIKTLINLLKLLDCFVSDAPLVSVLLSPFGGFSEEELLDVALYFKNETSDKRGGFYDSFAYYAENADTPLKEKIVAFNEKFARYRALADFKGAKGILEEMIADSGYENYLLCTDDGEEKIRRLYKFLAEAESGGKTRTVREFLRKIETASKAFECAGGGEEDAVSVMTMHASKGLEFPVVIVCGLERSFNRKDEASRIIFNRDEGFFACAFDDEKRTTDTTFYREIIKTFMRETQLKEEIRLFYVALTRAAYSLHLVFETSADTRKSKFSKLFTETACFLDFLPKSIQAKEHKPKHFGLNAVTREKRQILIAKSDREGIEKITKDLAFRYPYESATVLPLKNTVTAAVRRGAEDQRPVYSLFTEEKATDREKGIIAHKILENYDFNGEFDEEIKGMLERGVLTQDELDKVDTAKIRNVVSGGAFETVKGKTLFREQPFIVDIAANEVFDTGSKEEVLLQGVIDLLAISGDTAEIIDYKYSVLNADSLKKKYAVQLDLYAYAAERALKVKVVSKTLVNLFTGETVRLN
ncbi:MAG: UvrD-helicase domain-containing protein [Clostridia bacterium]|nr:UvrD-helicase domain-containing protein [Clostridia bacterium]